MTFRKTENMKEYMKQYREDHKEQLKNYLDNYMGNYYLNNKKRFYENNIKFRQQKLMCECGCEIKKYYLPKHILTEKHKVNLNNIIN
jgi:hypothetical protein